MTWRDFTTVFLVASLLVIWHGYNLNITHRRKSMQWNRLILLATVMASTTQSARILALFQLNLKSHFFMFEALLKELASRGHQVHVLSHFPQKIPVPNYIDLSVEDSLPNLLDCFTIDTALGTPILDYINALHFFWIQNLDMCKCVFEHSTIQNLFQSKVKYDLVITEIFGVDCLMGFGYRFQAPVINVISSVALPWSNDRVGNPDNPSYIPNYFLSFNDRMNFVERMLSMLSLLVLKTGKYIISDLPTNTLARQYFGEDLPPVSELEKNVSLILVNSHFSINQPRPLVPAMVEVGGLHIQTPGKLPQDIKQFLDDSPRGVIYFCLGSLVRGETFPEERRQAFVEAFRELRQRVLWKCDGDAIPDLPPNVKTAQWMPQLEILSHPKVRVFITHGGLMGTQEAVHYGVPMVGLPLFGDQFQNLHNYQTRGVAVVLDPRSVTKETVLGALRAVLEEPSYRENAQRLSRLFRDRPQSALDTAIYWTEYVIRHGGAPHLRSAAVDLPLYQYLLLDVIEVLLLGALGLIGILWAAVRTFTTLWRLRKICGDKTRTHSEKVKTK